MRAAEADVMRAGSVTCSSLETEPKKRAPLMCQASTVSGTLNGSVTGSTTVRLFMRIRKKTQATTRPNWTATVRSKITVRKNVMRSVAL